jgi:Domain of unknown function (DUF5122) beta-propeller
MKKSSLLILLVLIIQCNLEVVEPSNTGGGTKFSTKLGGGKNDFPNDVLVTKAGLYIVVGETKSFGAGDKQGYIVKVNESGKTLKENNFGGLKDDEAKSVIETPDGGFIFCGTFGQNNNNTDLYIVRTNAELDSIWTRVYSTTDSLENGLGIALVNDTSFVVSYFSQKLDGTKPFLNIAKYNLAGKRLSLVRARQGYLYLTRMIKTSDDKLVFVGSESDANGTASYIFKCGLDGTYIWEKRFTSSKSTFLPAYSVAEMANGDLIIAGSTLGTNDHDFNLVGYNQIGGELWNYSWGGANADELWSNIKNIDGEIVVAGYTGSFSGSTEIYVSKRRASDRSMVWENHFGSISVSLLDIESTKDGGFIIAAPQEEVNNGNADILLYKLDANGNYQ